ncbi:hypothetical protein [Pseudoalteromonas aurantia]|uniref:Uncharacterized protein n=1 Tax=Pseudoalteromonas aurantia 208 TaxID=1314867 RepID=A0ABR9E6X6_9GAMM|nr:hypothetical protein [Pseudoalteromonas aurantia]MBE0366711.1 hypothetical protein [Pseudoalteromonas aurantia 208]
MKKILAIGSLLCAVNAFADPGSVSVGGNVVELRFQDFSPITKPYAGREAVVAYEATFEMDGDFGQDLTYQVGGKYHTRWFVGSMAVSLSATCTGPGLAVPIFLGEDLATGFRYNRTSYEANPSFSNDLNTGGECQTMTVRLDKVGHLSRQFYTRVTDLQFNVHIIEKLPN